MARAGVPQTRSWVAGLVRSGLHGRDELVAEVVRAISADHRRLPARPTAVQWVGEEYDAWQRDSAGWPTVTDYDRLQRAFAAVRARGVLVLEGCADHWAARDALLDAEGSTLVAGVLWFTPPDIWHAVDEGMLELNLWHASGANAAPGDPLLLDVLDCFTDAGLGAVFDEGRIEVSAYWQRRPGDVEPV